MPQDIRLKEKYEYISSKRTTTESTVTIELRGCVQGVGLRSLASDIAAEMELTGWVRYTGDGLVMKINSDEELAEIFLQKIIGRAPSESVIEDYSIVKSENERYSSFDICETEEPSICNSRPTPDLSLCSSCRAELFDPMSRWYRFPFLSCNSCGWRFSITRSLPMVRKNLTIGDLHPLDVGDAKQNWRYLAETVIGGSSHPEVTMFNCKSELIADGSEAVIAAAVRMIREGAIVALKGLGMFYLLADAANEMSVQRMRESKKSSKPFYLIYQSIGNIDADFFVASKQQIELQNSVGAIVLLSRKPEPKTLIANSVSIGFSRIGVMLPVNPLIAIISHDFGQPIAFTNAGGSGDGATVDNEKFLERYGDLADGTILFNLLEVVPQVDSIVQLTSVKERRMVVRRSRGLAPNVYGYRAKTERTLLATGGATESVFALIHKSNTYSSQHLGNGVHAYTQEAYLETLNHFKQLLNATPNMVIADMHPGYFSHQVAESIAEHNRIPSDTVQHHKAHFASVLAENSLLAATEPILGVVWDGAAVGLDGNSWGGEFFTYSNGRMERVVHISYFPSIIGEKVAFEPRISALTQCFGDKLIWNEMEKKFSEREWLYYNKLLSGRSAPSCSSMSLLVDGVASMLNLCNRQTFPTNALILLEDSAFRYVSINGLTETSSYFKREDVDTIVVFEGAMQGIAEDLQAGVAVEEISYKFLFSLASLVDMVAANHGVSLIAFSGSVMQCALLVDILDKFLGEKYGLYFHKQLPPNDECVAFGQLVYFDQAIDSMFAEMS